MVNRQGDPGADGLSVEQPHRRVRVGRMELVAAHTSWLNAFADAITLGDFDELPIAGADLIAAGGSGAITRAAAVCANFEATNCVVDAVGVPVNTRFNDIGTELGRGTRPPPLTPQRSISVRSSMSMVSIAPRHWVTDALGSRPSVIAEMNSRSWSSIPSLETATPDRSTGFSYPSTKSS